MCVTCAFRVLAILWRFYFCGLSETVDCRRLSTVGDCRRLSDCRSTARQALTGDAPGTVGSTVGLSETMSNTVGDICRTVGDMSETVG